MEKKQHMRWTKTGAQMLLHARCALINGELGKYHRVVAHRFIAGAGRGGMNPQILSRPDLIARIWAESDPVYDLPAIDSVFGRKG
jgi:hypothetical protein